MDSQIISQPVVVAAIVSTFCAFFVGLINLYLTARGQNIQKGNNAQNIQLANDAANRSKLIEKWRRDVEVINLEKTRVSQKINEFYKPLANYLSNSSALYKTFKTLGKKPQDRYEFRTLLYLLDPETEYTTGKVVLTKQELSTLELIVKNISAAQKILLEKSAFIDEKNILGAYDPAPGEGIKADPEITTLNRIINHHDYFVIAFDTFKKNLGKKPEEKEQIENIDEFKQWVYPTRLNEFVESNLRRLEDQLQDLHSQLLKKYETEVK